MNLKDVKSNMWQNVYYDTGQINFNGNTIKQFLLTGCILRRDKRRNFYYQAELKDPEVNSIIIVPLEKVLLKHEV